MYGINKCLFKIKYISIAAFFHMEGELCKGHRHKICIGMIQSTYIFKTNTIDNRNGALLKKKIPPFAFFLFIYQSTHRNTWNLCHMPDPGPQIMPMYFYRVFISMHSLWVWWEAKAVQWFPLGPGEGFWFQLLDRAGSEICLLNRM